MSDDHSRYYEREYVSFDHSSPLENSENLLHFRNSLPANERDDRPKFGLKMAETPPFFVQILSNYHG